MTVPAGSGEAPYMTASVSSVVDRGSYSAASSNSQREPGGAVWAQPPRPHRIGPTAPGFTAADSLARART